MKLQINAKGSWRDIMNFNNFQLADVESAAVQLSRAAGGLRLRILDNDKPARYMDIDGRFNQLKHLQS